MDIEVDVDVSRRRRGYRIDLLQCFCKLRVDYEIVLPESAISMTQDGCQNAAKPPPNMPNERRNDARNLARRYSDPTTAVVQAWRGGGRWFTQQWTVTGFEPETATLRFDPASGMQGGEGMTSGGQWWIENVLEELDSANEWFFDAAAQRLHFQPNASDAGALALAGRGHRLVAGRRAGTRYTV